MKQYRCGICDVMQDLSKIIDVDEYPVRTVYPTHVLVMIGHTLPDLKPSRHRSNRIRKKLYRRLSKPLFEEAPRTMVVTSELLRFLSKNGSTLIGVNKIRSQL